MATIDNDTHFIEGVTSGTADQIVVADMPSSGKTMLRFVHYIKVTDNHVDEVEVIGDLQITNNDLHTLSSILLARIQQIEKQTKSN